MVLDLLFLEFFVFVLNMLIFFCCLFFFKIDFGFILFVFDFLVEFFFDIGILLMFLFFRFRICIDFLEN